jgi:pilus assembly protein FimV
VFLPGQLLSLGLGEIEVDSALNQPLNAQINLISARADELEEMHVELAPANVFDRVGVPRSYFLTQLKFKPITLPGGGTAIQVTSKDPVREPFLTFLVEVTWPKGRLLREYTVLLDPPEFAQQRAPQIATPVTTPATQEQIAVTEPVAAPQVSAEPVNDTTDIEAIRENLDRELGIADAKIVEEVVEEAAPVVGIAAEEPSVEEIEETVVESVVETQSVAEVADDIIIPEDISGDVMEAEVISESEVYAQASSAGELVVEGGDTLFAIAKSVSQSSSVTVNQMMLAIQQANPDAFARNNVNFLKKGAVLRIPDAGEVQSISTAEARREITNQNALWREYRATVSKTEATNVDAPELVKPEVAKEESSTAKEAKQALKEDIKKSASSKQDLNILAAENAKQSADKTQVAGGEELKKLQNEIRLNKELAESKGKEAEELKSRVEALESMLEKKEKILNIQNQQLKGLQQQLGTEADKAAAAEKMLKENAVKEEVKTEVKTETKPVEKPVAEEIKKPVVESLPELTEPVVAEQVVSKPRLEPLPDWDSLPEIEPVKEEVVAEVKPTEVKPDPKPAEVKPEQKPVEVKPVETPTPEAETGLMATVMGFVDTLKQHASKAALGLVGLAGLLGLVWWRKKRSYKTLELTGVGDIPLEAGEDGEHFDDILDETIVTPQTNAADAAQVTEEDYDAVDDFGAEEDTGFAASGDDASADAELGEEVLDEADVYISYGLHQQAQDLLTEAIAKEPNNNEYKVKLAEVYYSQKDQQGFEQYAEKIKDDVGESSSQWQNVLAMGKEIAPASALFAGAAAVGATAKAVLDKPDEADVDIGLQTILDNPLADANLEDTILDNDANDDEDGLNFNIDDPATEDEFEDDPVASKIMEVNETSDILNFEVDDLSDDAIDDDSNTELDAIATGLHESASMNDLTEELEQIGMQTTMNDLKPLDIDESELDVADPLDDTVAMQSDDLDIDTSLSPADPEETAAYTSSAISHFNADDTEQFDVGNIDTEFLDPAEQTVAQTHTDLQELGPPSLMEEVGTKLDLAKAFVDMGDSDAAKETLLEVINEGDESQIKAAKDLMDKLGS